MRFWSERSSLPADQSKVFLPIFPFSFSQRKGHSAAHRQRFAPGILPNHHCLFQPAPDDRSRFSTPFIGCTSWSNGFVWFFIIVFGTHLQIDGTAKCPVAGFTVHCACVSHIGASIVLEHSGAFTAVVPLYLRYSGPFIPCPEERSRGRCWKYGRKAFSSKLFDEFAGGCYQSVFWHCRPEKSLLRNYNGDSFFSGSFYIFHYLLYTQTDDSLQKVKNKTVLKR